MNEDLRLQKEKIDNGEVYPGYPSRRLFLTDVSITETGLLHLPDGPWQATDDTPPTVDETRTFQDAGYAVDSLGRPLHPWHQEMLAEIGIITGKGFYYNWGPNYTADPIVTAGGGANRKVLLIKRGDTGVWALPGGFVDPGENALTAAVREVHEEAGLINTGKPVAQIYKGVVADLRTTVHSWAETTAFLFEIDKPVDVEFGDDAIGVGWFDQDGLPDNLHGSHAEMIKIALEYQHPTTLGDILALPTELLTISEATGGHMAYDHMIIEGPNDRLFAKAHDPKLFTDPVKEQHSLLYLQKEQHYFDHLRENGFTHIPNRTELVEDILVMDALTTKDGWHWRLPTDSNECDKYISDILSALNQLEQIDPPAINFHEQISPTYQTIIGEGWDDIGDDKVDLVIDRIKSFMCCMNSPTRVAAFMLINEFDDMRAKGESIPETKSLVMSHGDARQSNIAWHPDHGAVLVDWSWADLAPQYADSTMFLIDLAKSGYDVSGYMDSFNVDYALQLIGFWLNHSLLPTHDGSDTVRFHQIASAATAFDLIQIEK